jgi:protein-S-isoprenylcysteine O-methyltransferase Ste14
VQILLAASWGLFLAVWLVTAVLDRRTAPPAERRSRWWSSGVLAGACCYLVLLLVPGTLWTRLTVHVAWVAAVGASVLVVSLAFTVWARLRLGTMWTATPTIKAGHQLRTDGPYARVRHPIYAGLLGMMVGTVLVDGLGPPLVVLLVVVVTLVRKIRTEERMLTEKFPEAYPAYRATVPALIPWPRPRTSSRR